jgi:putative glycosyltransferase (TIGR04372 family)
MDSRYFGHQALEPEVFCSDQISESEAGGHDFWRSCIGPRRSASNTYLWDLAKQRLPLLPSWFVTAIAHWTGRFKFPRIVLEDASIYRLNFLTSRKTTLPLGSDVVARRNEILSHLAQPDRPYVVFTIREFDPNDQHNDLRNRQIADFGLAMSELVSRGFNVIRLMSRTKDPLMVADRHHLDWQVERDGEPGDELAVFSGAAFVVPTTTGGDCLALAYRRPVLYLDCFRFPLVFLGTELATFSIPRLLDSVTREQLALHDVLDRGLGWVADQRLFFREGVTVLQSDPQKIRSQVIEYAENLSERVVMNQDRAQQLWRS